MLRHLYSRVYLARGRRGCSAALMSVAVPKVPSCMYISKVGDDDDVSLSPVKIYQGSSTLNSFHAYGTCDNVRFFSGLHNIPRNEALKYMPRLKKANSEVAINILKEIERDGFIPDVFHYSAAISKCAIKDGKLDEASNIFGQMKQNKVAPKFIFNTLIGACEITFSAAISACEKGGAEHTDGALALFHEMCNRNVWPTAVTYSATISACEKGGAEYTDTALALFAEMKAHGIMPDVVVFSAVISACGKGGGEYVEVAIRHFDEMKRRPNEIFYSTIAKTCYDNQRYPEARKTVQEAVSTGFLSPLIADAKQWDLHRMREALACVLLANALLSSVDAKSFRDILVITVKGKHSEEGPVLQLKVPAFLRDVAGLELSEHVKRGEVNDGAFVISKTALKKWAKSDDFNRFRNLMTGKEKE